MKVLTHSQIQQKIKRLAFQIVEQNYEEKDIYLAGINNNGMNFAKLLLEELKSIGHLNYHLIQVKLNPANPVSEPISYDIPIQQLAGKVVLLIDDVANTGRTVFFAMKPLLTIIPKRVEAAVLVDRKHKLFPISVDYVGLSLATTLKENIDVKITDQKDLSVFLN